MSTAFNILLTHRYGANGGAPAICVGADGMPTDCRWKARRGKHAPNYGTQHHQHLADLIDTAYAEPRGLRLALVAIRDVLDDWDTPLPATTADVRAASLHREISGCLADIPEAVLL